MSETSPTVSAAATPPSSLLGLQQPPVARVGYSRKAPVKPPIRTGPLWETVTVTTDHATTPNVICKNCSATFSAGATRIRTHITLQCTCETDAFCALKDRLLSVSTSGAAAKRQKAAEEDMLHQADKDEKKDKREKEAKRAKFEFKQPGKQQGIQASINSSLGSECDDALAEMWFGLNIPASNLAHPLVKRAFAVLKSAPASYVLPTRHRMNGELLDRTAKRLRTEEKPVRDDMWESDSDSDNSSDEEDLKI
jgi:hypothetical protein